MSIESEHLRIKIAKYIGKDAGFFAPNFDIPIFDPANREADDYYCLKGVREWRQDQFSKFCSVVRRIWMERVGKQVLLEDYGFVFGMYETGDYMNAYLEVMDNE